MLRDLKQNEKGVVFITVLMIIIVMMTLAISVISVNVSQVMVTEGETKRLQAEILAMGALTRAFANQMSPSPGNNISYPQTLGNITFNLTANLANCPSCPYSTNSLNIYVTY